MSGENMTIEQKSDFYVVLCRACGVEAIHDQTWTIKDFDDHILELQTKMDNPTPLPLSNTVAIKKEPVVIVEDQQPVKKAKVIINEEDYDHLVCKKYPQKEEFVEPINEFVRNFFC